MSTRRTFSETMKSVRLVGHEHCIVRICGTGELLAGNVTAIDDESCEDEDDNRACVKYGESVP